MPDQPNKFYVTTPIYYVNARPHIGHAYSTLVADVLARRHRLLGDDVYFLTGTDEHGQKIERSAAAAGIPPQQFTDQVSKTFSDLWQRMGITHDDFIRTTEPRHKIGVQKLFRTLYERGHIYLSTYTGAYCVSDEAFVDAPIGTPCPDCGKLLEEVTEENFFFRLSAFQQPLLDLIESNTLTITPDSARNEVLSFIRGSYASALQEFMNASGKPQFAEGVFSPEDGEAAINAGYLLKSNGGELYNPKALRDLSISRSSFTWGIPVPDEVQRDAKATQPHVIYVWLDALANYMTALGYGSTDTTLFDKFWPADLHLVGKEITRFHCVYWPAFLLGLNPDFGSTTDVSSRPEAAGRSGETCVSEPPQLSTEQHLAWAKKMVPKQVTANGWLLFDNAKMSKSKGNVVRTETILEGFGSLCPPTFTGAEPLEAGLSGTEPRAPGLSGGSSGLQPTESTPPEKGALALGFSTPTHADRDLFATDVLRYYLLREIPFGQDGSFSFDAMITRYNADLANGYGNLVSRTLAMIQKYFDGAIPEPQALGTSVADDIKSNLSQFNYLIDEGEFTSATAVVQAAVAVVDGALTEKAPWKKSPDASDDFHKVYQADVLYPAAEAIRIITALLYPIMPFATAKVWHQLGLGDIELAARNGELKNLQWGGLKPGTRLGPLAPIFPRADKGLAQIMIDHEETLATGNSQLATESTKPAEPAPAPAAPAAPLASPISPLESQEIAIDDFIKIELRIAEIKLAERIPKADKLLRLEVDLGPLGQRQILSGIAEHYAPEDLIGRRIIVITNLAPRKMRGLESHGMLLAASEGDGKPYLATVPEGVPLGTRLK